MAEAHVWSSNWGHTRWPDSSGNADGWPCRTHCWLSYRRTLKMSLWKLMPTWISLSCLKTSSRAGPEPWNKGHPQTWLMKQFQWENSHVFIVLQKIHLLSRFHWAGAAWVCDVRQAAWASLPTWRPSRKCRLFIFRIPKKVWSDTDTAPVCCSVGPCPSGQPEKGLISTSQVQVSAKTPTFCHLNSDWMVCGGIVCDEQESDKVFFVLFLCARERLCFWNSWFLSCLQKFALSVRWLAADSTAGQSGAPDGHNCLQDSYADERGIHSNFPFNLKANKIFKHVALTQQRRSEGCSGGSEHLRFWMTL